MGLFRPSQRDIAAGQAAAERRATLNARKAATRAEQRREADARQAIARAHRRAR
jgi:hypothetical protein